MNPWLFLFLWAGSQVLQLILAAFALSRRPDLSGQRRLGGLALSAAASVLPLLTLVLFLMVFVIGGSSNVAQHAGESGMGLWRLWFHAWPLLFFSNPLAFLLAVVAVLVPPYPPSHWTSFASRVCAVVAAGCAWYAVVAFFPDA
jgi:hypothetical protein